jgi:hypothetical protein
MENNDDVVKKALAVALAKAGHKDVDSFLKAKGVEMDKPELKVEKDKVEKKYCDRSCQGVIQLPSTPVPEKEEKRLTPIWPIEPETIIEWKGEVELREKAKVAFLKGIDTLEHLSAVRASAVEAVSKIPARYVPSISKKQEDKEERREAKAKAKTEKKVSTRQKRLGQTKLIDELLKAGKNEKEVFDAVREKIPTYPADRLPKLIKLRQYVVKKKL